MKFVLLAMALFAQDPTKEVKHRWAGATVGSWVKWKTKSSMRGSPIDELNKESVSEHKETVVKVEKEFIEVQQENGDTKSPPQQIYVGLPSWYQGTVTKLGEEEIELAGKKLKCTVYEIRKELQGVVQSLKFWKCPDVPVFAVKEEWSHSIKGKKQLGWIEEWAGEETLSIGGKEYKCQIFRKTTELEGNKTVETEWRNPEIVGGLAKRTSQNFVNGGFEITSESVVTEFERK